ncbi:Diphthine synthase [Rozella allomycis CSF55]|uniref:diphthine methyl ester synthase n=1 Tax=Rozella allomycis (strain CSF55) TaxID=988480 RepID=A0A075AUD3_ROZAC|nr:Tetrapyrrole methylase domain-containing protein [Rozella allomycis CSF55]RKP21056.1 Diphthine synthase [Rozella allomycis CSF55]|eukprot:EPZ32337.1 Tetrapyrrole methylase domain-containing protein [Rozella allomycis CSF55]
MLFIIGLGLADEKDISVKGLEAIKSCSKVYLESYTSLLLVSKERLETFYGKSIIEADRECVESFSDEIILSAKTENVAFLVVGDPFGATTHTDFVLRAIKDGINYKIIHNASIMNVVGVCGLQLYRFGQTVSIPFFTESWKPDSFYDKIKANLSLGLHTLCLLDIKVKEQSEENLLKGKKIYEPPRFMTVWQALEQILYVEKQRKEDLISKNRKVIGISKAGSDEQCIKFASINEFLNHKEVLGGPLHSLIIPSDIHEIENEMLEIYA